MTLSWNKNWYLLCWLPHFKNKFCELAFSVTIILVINFCLALVCVHQDVHVCRGETLFDPRLETYCNSQTVSNFLVITGLFLSFCGGILVLFILCFFIVHDLIIILSFSVVNVKSSAKTMLLHSQKLLLSTRRNLLNWKHFIPIHMTFLILI